MMANVKVFLKRSFSEQLLLEFLLGKEGSFEEKILLSFMGI